MGCEHSTPVPPESAFTVVHTQKEPYLGEKTLAIPKADGTITDLVVKERAFRSWSGDSFTIKTTNGEKYAGGIQIKGKAVSMRDKMLLVDADGNPIAVCLKQFFSYEQTFRIYGFRPIHPEQKASQNVRHENHPLYAWAECKDKAFSVQYTLSIWNGTIYVPTFVSNNVGAMIGPQKLLVTKHRKPACIFQKTNLEFFCGQVWKLKISPGIDPCLMICFVAIIDEMMEK